MRSMGRLVVVTLGGPTERRDGDMGEMGSEGGRGVGTIKVGVDLVGDNYLWIIDIITCAGESSEACP